MKFTRQQIMLGALGLIGLVRVGDYVLNSWIAGPLEERHAKADELQDTIGKYREVLADTRTAGQKIAIWQKQSLPSDVEVARSSYRNWLLDIVNTAGMKSATVDSSTPVNRRGLYQALPFTVRGRATLKQLTRLLFDFSQAGHLHRLQSINLKTPTGAGDFDVSLSLEALVIPVIKRSDRLGTAESNRLASPSVEDYAVISRNNIFGLGYADPLASSQLTAITFSNGKPQAWISRANERTARVGVGESIEIGDFSAVIDHLTDEEMTLKVGDRKIRFALGQNLSQGTPSEF
jgi:hypothetical protein